jgi:hypothetical protein
VLQRLNSAVKLIQRTTPEAPQRRYVLHGTGCSQEDDQLLREGRGWSRASGRKDRSTRHELDAWIKTLPQPRTIALLQLGHVNLVPEVLVMLDFLFQSKQLWVTHLCLAEAGVYPTHIFSSTGMS